MLVIHPRSTAQAAARLRQVLVCKLLSKEEVHPETFKNAHRRFKIIDRATMVRKNFNQPATESEAAKRETKLIAGDRRKRRKLEALGELRRPCEGLARCDLLTSLLTCRD